MEIPESFHWLGEKYHVINKFHDGYDGEVLCVVKKWNKYKQRWVYEVVSGFMINYKMQLEKKQSEKELT